MVLGSLAFGTLFIHFEQRQLVENLVNYASSLADLVNRSIQYGMLSGRRDLMRQDLQMISEGKRVRFIRIYGPDGKLRFSSEAPGVAKAPGASKTQGAPYEPPAIRVKDINALATTHSIVGAGAQKTLLYITPIKNGPRCHAAACHFHGKGNNVLGVLEEGFYTKDVDRVVSDNKIGTALIGGLFILVISASLFIILYRLVSKPVALLEDGMKRVADCELDEPIDINTRDEMGLLARTFNSMMQDLKLYRESRDHWAHNLEEEIKRKTGEMMRTQESLINTEKLASLGRMSAGIAHELNSPLTGIITFAHLLRNRVPDSDAEAREDLQVVIDQAERCAKIIKGLLGFSRGAGFEMTQIGLNTLLESTISMISHQSRFYNIKFDLRLSPGLPPVFADPNQIQQVFLNMLMNASDAMDQKGFITITTRLLPAEDGRRMIETEFTDTGPGIAEADLLKIFEPFFTTKPVGQGTGLGLSVSYGIIKKYGGDILAKSVPGQGAIFLIRLPAREKGDEDADEKHSGD